MSLDKKDNEMHLKLNKLHTALNKHRSEQYIDEILQDNFDVNYKAPNHFTDMLGEIGMTALHLAQHERRIDISKLLLRYGANITMKNNRGSTALHEAIERGHKSERFILLQATYQFINLILSAHIHSNNFSNPINGNGISHFHIACIVNNVAAVKFFLENGVSVDEPIDMKSSILSGYTALHITVRFYNFETLSVLLEYNANVQLKNSYGVNPTQMCIEQKLDHFNEKNQCTMVKRSKEFADKILLLLMQKCSFVDDVGLSHLHISCVLADSSTANSLLEQDINIDQLLNIKSPIFRGYTALHFAARFNIDTVKLLVTRGANMELKNSSGLTPLDLCIKRCTIKTLHSIFLCHPVWKDILLVDNKTKLPNLIYALTDMDEFELIKKNTGLNLNKSLIPNDSPLWPGYTILHLIIALETNSNYLFYGFAKPYILDTGVDLATRDIFGSTPLHLAAEKNTDSKKITHMWNSCKDIDNLVNKNNLSYIHLLCSRSYNVVEFMSKYKNSDLVKKLLLKDKQMKVDSHIPYKGPNLNDITSGSTPLQVATGNVEITKILVEHGADIYAVDAKGFTPIHLLYPEGGKHIEEILQSMPDLKDSVVDSIGLSHLHVACCISNVKIAEKLMDRGANINLRISTELPDNLSSLAKYAGYTPLHSAVMNDQKRVVDFLLQHGADIFAKNADGLSLIYEILNSAQSQHLTTFVDTLKMSYPSQNRFNEETGLTIFHVACYKFDIQMMKHYFVNAKVNVNTKARLDSPIWSGLTALHILADRMRLLSLDTDDNFYDSSEQVSTEDKAMNDNLVDKALKFLLTKGADVTMVNSFGKTPLHVFFGIAKSCEKDYTRIISLLEAHKDFKVNPIDREGLSHFHIACAMNDAVAVRQFLKQGVGVNESNHQGDTPLHLSAGSSFVEFSGSLAQLKTIKLLLRHGAEVNVKNNLTGDTPLHLAASNSSAVDANVLKILLKAGADSKAKNTYCRTSLELLCRSKLVSAKPLKLFGEYGCHLNSYNTDKKGFIGILLSSNYKNTKWNSLWKAVLNNLSAVTEVDILGRSVIHNIVSMRCFEIPRETYLIIIEQLMNDGCDIDLQDNTGQTALHKAAKFTNFEAVSALIDTGADVNNADETGETALALAVNDYNHSITSYINSVIRKLLWQVIILESCHLYVCQVNQSIKTQIFLTTNVDFTESFKSLTTELNRASDVKIGDSLTLRHFLSEETVANYPYTALSNRDAIYAFVNSIDDSEFVELKPVIKYQFQMAEKRIYLVKDATSSLRTLSNSLVPDICTRIIFECLRNNDLANLITAGIKDV